MYLYKTVLYYELLLSAEFFAKNFRPMNFHVFIYLFKSVTPTANDALF